jgi:hypothetical protein
LQLDSDDSKASLAAAKDIMQGTRLSGETDLPKEGPTTPEGVLLPELRREARQKLAAKEGPAMPRLFDPFWRRDFGPGPRLWPRAD